jgi:hypothetical protein
MAGGWGACYDLGTSEVLGKKITEANANSILPGSVSGYIRLPNGKR